MWSKQHDSFALEHKLPPAAALLWRWLMSQGETEDIEPDLNDFNRWVERKRGKGYCRQTLKDAVAKLEEIGIIRIARRFTWRVSRLVVRSLKWVKENLRERKEICDSSAETPSTKKPGVNSSSFRSSTPPKTPPHQVDYLCKLYKVPFLEELINFDIEDVRDALKLFKVRNRGKGILNPVGWLLRCLNSRWIDDQNQANPAVLMNEVCLDGLNYMTDGSWQGEDLERIIAEQFLQRIE